MVRTATSRRPTSALVLTGLTALAGAATIIASDRALQLAGDAHRRAATVAADQLRAELTAATSALAGTDALAADGIVDDVEFRAFARGVIAASAPEALAWSQPVSAGERDEWEDAAGVGLREIDATGEISPATERAAYVVVGSVMPDAPENAALVGLDLLGEPVRGGAVRAASESDRAVLAGPIELAGDGRPGLFVVRAVRDPERRVVGYVSSGVGLDPVIDRIESLPDVDRVGVAIDGRTVVAAGSGTETASFDLSGHRFEVAAAATVSAGWSLPLSLGLGTTMLGVGAFVARRRESHERSRREAAHRRADLLRALAEELVPATSTTSVLDVVARRGSDLVGARRTEVGRRSASDVRTLEVVRCDRATAGTPGRDPDDEPDHVSDTAQVATLAMDAASPLTESVRTGSIVFVPTRDELLRRFPAACAGGALASTRAVLCAPLSLGNEVSVGVIGFEFDHELDVSTRDDLESLVALVGQLTGRAFDRAFARELVQQRVELLSEFTRVLTEARSVDDVTRCVVTHLPPVLDLRRASVVDPTTAAASEPTSQPGRSYPLSSPDGERLELELHASRMWTSTDDTLAHTVADLVGAAMTRARLHDQEHAVLQRFQATLLVPPPDVDGFAIAVGYRSALETIGIGGDWYSVIDTPDHLFAVIGDVAGHGPGAVALMAEAKTVLRHLLTTGTSMEDSLRHAHDTLARRQAFASATIVRVDKRRPVLHVVNAGHLLAPAHTNRSASGRRRPPTVVGRRDRPAVRGDRGAVRSGRSAADVHRRTRRGTRHDHRRQRRRARRLVARQRPVDVLVEALVRERMRHRTDRTVDDDIAVVAISRADDDRLDAAG
ncbi:MAG: CHASE domain-containing protein [Ilumatobacteraceae bacterium]